MHTIQLAYLARHRQNELLRVAAHERLVAAALAARQQVPPPQPSESLKGRMTSARALVAAGVRAERLRRAPAQAG